MGDNDEDVIFDAYSTPLNVNSGTQSFELEEDDRDDEKSVTFGFTIPQNAQPGNYPVFLRARYSGRSTDVPMQISVQDCGTQTPPARPTPTVQNNTQVGTVGTGTQTPITTPGTTVYSDRDLFDRFNSADKIPTTFWIVLDVIIAILVIGLLIWLFSRRR